MLSNSVNDFNPMPSNSVDLPFNGNNYGGSHMRNMGVVATFNNSKQPKKKKQYSSVYSQGSTGKK